MQLDYIVYIIYYILFIIYLDLNITAVLYIKRFFYIQLFTYYLDPFVALRYSIYICNLCYGTKLLVKFIYCDRQ